MNNNAWVKYRLPGETTITAFSGEEFINAKAESLGNSRYFIYSPFSLDKLLCGFKIADEKSTPCEIVLTDYTGSSQSHSKEEYVALVSETVHRITSGAFQKVVHSRFKFVPANVNPETIFNALVAEFPSAFVYLLNSPAYGTWCGATPEVLLVEKNNNWLTMALAGTRKLSENNSAWSPKDIAEQGIVAALIYDKLSNTRVTFSQGESYTRPAGSIAHICSDFIITDIRENSFVSLAQHLHPTPAICGYPVNEAYLRIYGVEKNSRELYSGLLGISDSNKSGNLFINLRCTRLFKNGIRIHAGGGINAFSDPLKEWEETEIKMKTILDVINL
ncbi:MAG: chorismate-binding protein [Flavobacteriales bacterium]